MTRPEPGRSPHAAELLLSTRCALLVIDMQNDFCHPAGVHGAAVPVKAVEAVLKPLDRLISSARAAGCPCVFVRGEHESATNSRAWSLRGGSRVAADVPVPGTWGSDWFGVRPLPEDAVVVKHRYSAFVATDLELRLRAAMVETVLLSGCSAHVCVESTGRDACMRDFFVIAVADCIVDATESLHLGAMERIADDFGVVSTSADLVAVWQSEKAAS